VDHLDGVTVDLGRGSWFNLRGSNTEPLLRLNVEALSAEDVAAVVDQIRAEIDAVIAAVPGGAGP
ncbi:MAG: phosphomannomutase/phosphoglucomutase, partial [Solirubrobacteraceae bacterium]